MGLAIGGAYLTFSSFEPLFDRASRRLLAPGSPISLSLKRIRPVGSFQHESSDRIGGAAARHLAASQEPTGARRVVLSANDYGHFHAVAQIKGQQVEFMTDTGATYVALSYETAQKLGLAPQNLRFNGRSTTANGVARVASIVLDTVRIGDITVKDVQAVIAEPGRMTQNLLGMSFIRQLSGFELSGARLTMIE